MVRLIYACTIKVFYCFHTHFLEDIMNSLWKQNQVNFQVYFCNIFNVNSVYITLCSLMEHLSKFVCRFRISDFKFFVWQKLKCNFLLFMFIFMRWRWRPWDEKVVCVLFALFFWFRLFFFRGKTAIKKHQH